MIYRFEDFSLDSDRRELRRRSEVVPVEPQVFDVLEFLVRNHKRIVSKDDLIAGVWDGRIVSDSTLSSRITAVRQAIGDDGQGQRLIRTVSRRGFRFVGSILAQSDAGPIELTGKEQRSASSPSEDNARSLSDRPSIAVLPFASVSEGPSQDYLVDGITEEIIVALSQFRWLLVIGRGSSFAYKGRTIDAKQVGRELGVRYLVEGSVRKAENRVRIAAQLIDTETGFQLSSNRFDGTLDDIFELQDRITETVVGAIGVTLEQAEIERSKRKPTDSLVAYDFYLRGMASFHAMTKQSVDDALRLFKQAIELDGRFAAAYGMAAYCYSWRKTNGWTSNYQQDVSEAARLAHEAAQVGRDDPIALGTGGFALAHVVGDLEAGLAMIERALALNPNLAHLWLLCGWVRTYLSDPERAIEDVQRAIRRSPFDPQMFAMQLIIAFAHFIAGRYDEGSWWADRALQLQPSFAGAARVAAASHAYAGRMDQARAAMRRLREIYPTLRVSTLSLVTPLRDPDDLRRYGKGLSLAGLPD